jgi:hypothetical protein
MNITRRKFLGTSVAGGATILVGHIGDIPKSCVSRYSGDES